MTDPTGASFLSYRRCRAAEAKLLIEAQHDHGIPTWQDITDLPSTPTEQEIRHVLGDPATANGILLITPEVERSDMIRKVEAPLILERHERGDGFFGLPLAAGGLDYADLPRVLGPHCAFAGITGWNVEKLTTNPLGADEAANTAALVLDQRLDAINRSLPPGEPLKLQISTRAALAKNSGCALALDLAHRFSGREALSGAWEGHIVPAFCRVVRSLQRHGAGREVSCSGSVAIPAAVALGSAFLSLAGVSVTWSQDQRTFGKCAENWHLGAARRAGGFSARTQPRNLTSDDVAVLVSVSADIEHDFNLTAVAMGLDPRVVVKIASAATTTGGRPQLGPEEACDVAHVTVEALRDAWRTYQVRGTVHLFLAVPVGLAFLIGQLLNTFGAVQTYEHVPGEAVPYRPAARFNPSCLTVI